MKRLKAGLMGLEGVGGEYLSALAADGQFEVVGVGDPSTEMLRRHAEGSEIPGYEDCRSLIVEQARDGLDVLFVAMEPFQSLDFVELAAKSGVAVFHKAPFARTVGEGQRLVRVFDSADCPLIVSRPWQFDAVFASHCRPAIDRSGAHTVTALICTQCGPAGWRGDSARAGGGVLLNGAYEQVDLLVQLLGVPESVYAQCVIASSSKSACAYDTEDAVQILLRFSGQRTGSLTAWRGAAESAWRVVFAAGDQTIELTGGAGKEGAMTICGQESTTTHATKPQQATEAAIRAVGRYRTGRQQRIDSHAREHLPTLAVIEAAYLSARTGEPESPARFLA